MRKTKENDINLNVPSADAKKAFMRELITLYCKYNSQDIKKAV